MAKSIERSPFGLNIGTTVFFSDVCRFYPSGLGSFLNMLMDDVNLRKRQEELKSVATSNKAYINRDSQIIG